jgi:XTP/dITP diphosphohydrolase
MKIYLATTNQKKMLTAQKALSEYGVDLEMLKLDYEVPEIQSFSVEEIAKFSAKFVADKENKPVFVTDAAFSIESLNGFPGPFMKQINHYLTTEDILNLLRGKTNRKFNLIECLAFCQPNQEPITFSSTMHGTMTEKAEGEGLSIDRIMKWDGLEKVEALCSEEEMVEYYSKHLDFYQQFGQYYSDHLK